MSATDKAAEALLMTILAGVSQPKANLQLPDPRLRDIYRDEESRIVWVTDEIDESSLDIAKKIMQYNLFDKDIPVEERTPIKLFIDTPGGSVSVMRSIVSAIKMSTTPIWTVNWCEAMSAGAHILAAGHKRFAMAGSTVLIHTGSCSFSGTAEMVDSAKKYYDAQSKAANDQLLSDTKIDPKIFKKKASQDWYLDTEEAIQYGVIDKVLDTFDEVLK